EVQRLGPPQLRAADHVLDRFERPLLPGRLQSLARLLAEPADVAPPDADGGVLRVRGFLEGAVPLAPRQAGGPHVYACATRVVHEGGWRVEAHRPRVEQAEQKGGGVMRLQIRRRVGDEGEAPGVA